MLANLIESLTQANTLIARIDYALIELDHQLQKELLQHPESVNYGIDPNTFVPDRYIVCEYPQIHVFLPPFKTIIKYEDVFSAIKNNNYEISNIIDTIIALISKELSRINFDA